MQHTYGAIPSPPDPRDYKARDHVAMGNRPKSYMPPVLAPIANQGMVVSCVAQALALIKTYQEHRERGRLELYSTDFIYWNRKPDQWQGQGMYAREALANLCKDGTPPREALPGNYAYVPGYAETYLTAQIRALAKPQIISKYAACQTVDEMCNCIFANGPVAILTGVYDSFDSFTGWQLPEPKPSEQRHGAHAIAAIGYNADGLIIQNSWGDRWGKNGLALIPYDYSPVTERWIVVDKVSQWDVIELWVGQQKYRRNGVEGALEVPPKIEAGRTLVPLRFIGEALGASVEYQVENQKITLRKER